MLTIDLSPFGFTRTEALVYAALLRLGPATGYSVARETRIARANAYAALEGLVRKGAATRLDERPLRFRAADGDTLLAQLAAGQAEALERLERSLHSVPRGTEPITREVAGGRPLANVVTQLVARAERSVRGVIAAELWRPTLPAWRRAAARATLEIHIAGEAPDPEGLSRGIVPADVATLLVIDDSRAIMAAAAASHLELPGLWTGHPLIVQVAAAALQARS